MGKVVFVLQMNWTPCHIAVHYGHVDCLDLLLTFEGEKSDKLNVIKPEISQVVDRDGWTLAHLAASKDSSVGVVWDYLWKFLSRSISNKIISLFFFYESLELHHK